MSEFDPFAAMRTMDGPVNPPEAFGEALYDTLRARLDEFAVGAPRLPEPPASLPRRGLVVAVTALASVLLMGVLLSWLSPQDQGDGAVEPPLLSEPDTPTSGVDHNPDPAVISPATSVPRGQSPVAVEGDGYQFGGWEVLPVSKFDGRQGAAVAWTGNELIVWGGSYEGSGDSLDARSAMGGTFNPATDVWVGMPPSPVAERSWTPSLWTGTELLVFGSGADGAAYNPSARTWRPLVPRPLSSLSAAVWTGSEAILFGGAGPYVVAYDPVAARWRDIPLPAQTDWSNPQAVWTGTEMIVWSEVVRGYFPAAEPVWAFDIAAYNPATDVWRRFAPPAIEFELSSVAGVWTGTELVLWGANFERLGGADGFQFAGVGLNPVTEEWRMLADPPFAERNATERFVPHSAVWIGDQMLLWVGARSAAGPGPELWSYDPVADAWQRGASSPLDAHDPQLIWTGDTLYAYGGRYGDLLPRVLRIDLADGTLPAPLGTTSTIPPDVSVPFEVLGIDRDARTTYIADFAAGYATTYEADESVLSAIRVYSVLPMWDGWMASVRGAVWWYPDGVARLPVLLQNEPGGDGPYSDFTLFLAAEGDVYSNRIWTVIPGAGYGEFDEPSVVRQISVLDGTVATETSLPPDATPVVSSTTGLLINQHGWMDTGDGFVEDPATRKMMLVAPDGSVTPLWSGRGIDLAGDRVVWLDCDQEGEGCRIVVSSLSAGPQSADLIVGDDSATYAISEVQPGAPLVSPDGRWLIAEETGPTTTALVRIDLTTGSVLDRGSLVGWRIHWSSDSEWLLDVDAGPIAVRIADGMRVDLSEWVPPDVQIYGVASD